MLGKPEPYSDVPWFWSDQYDCNVQYAGHHTGWDGLVVRGDLDARDAVVFYLEDSRIAAVAGINRGKDVQRAMALIKTRAQPDLEALRDENVDLRSLVPGARQVRTRAQRIAPRPVARPDESK
jgi:3-phenylpropionate/trans-cinnamate dioxygenase ferredoxin reductase subunit